MKKHFKFLATGLLALCTVGVTFACSSGNKTPATSSEASTEKTWADMNYGDYDSMYDDQAAPEGTEGYWDYWETKSVQWQFINDKTGAENHGFANYFPTLLNLYQDGSIKAWQRTFLIPSMFDSLEDEDEARNTYNNTYKIVELWYGYWEQAGTNVTIHIQSSFDYGVEGADTKYSSYSFNSTPNAEGKISFYINVTEKGQAIKSYMTCDTNYTGTIQYTSYVNFATGVKEALPGEETQGA